MTTPRSPEDAEAEPRSPEDAEAERIMARHSSPPEPSVPGSAEANERLIREAEDAAGLSKFRQNQLIINALTNLQYDQGETRDRDGEGSSSE